MLLNPEAGGRTGLFFVRGMVADVAEITPRMRHIRLSVPAGLSWIPGQQIRLRLGRGLRTYSIWAGVAGSLELCVLDHGDGPGARWVRSVRAGDEVRFRKPEGRLVVVPSAAYHVFAGEETASVAFGAMLGALPASAAVYGAIEVADETDRLPLPRSAELTWRYRGAGSAASSAGLVEAVRSLDLPESPGVAYLAGEARTCQAIRLYLIRERGWPRRSVVVKPFWTPGKRGME
ncbi:MAG TPA: siderophore-interacting protein [Streptosporangiaceae bacterium]|nr:siderophore-interacting protein [Streptosporangiaceae bacterium]